MKGTNGLFRAGMAAFALAFMAILAGCASTGSKAEPGTLTITGIPAEFNGKFAILSDDLSAKISSGEKGIPIADGAVALPLYKKSSSFSPFASHLSAYVGNDTYNITLCITDTPEVTKEKKIPPSADYPQGTTEYTNLRTPYASFEAVTFASGVATVEWDSLFKDAGSLIITGIPDEYKGKFVSSRFSKISTSKLGAIVVTSTNPLNMVIDNGVITASGEFKQPLRIESGVFKKTVAAYTGPGDDTIYITLNIFDTASQQKAAVQKGVASAVIRFDGPVFDNGVATVPWDKAKIAGTVTVTDIPAKYNDKDAAIRVDYSVSAVGGAIGGLLGAVTDGVLGDGGTSAADASGTVRDGTLIVHYFGNSSTEANATDKKEDIITATGAKDFLVSIQNGEKKESGGMTVYLYDRFLFKGAQLATGKASLKFGEGAKQK